MPTTTEHLKALLINDGHEFAMVRKADLAALLQIAETDPHQGRYLDPIGEKNSRIEELESVCDEYSRVINKQTRTAMKHGDERRRYMANNKALLARVDQQDYAFAGLTRQWEGQRVTIFSLIDQLKATSDAEVAARVKLRNFKRKFPAIGALMDATP